LQGAEVRKNKKTKKTGAAVGNPSKPSVEARQEDAVKKPAIKQEDAVMNPAIKQEQDVAEAEEAQQPQVNIWWIIDRAVRGIFPLEIAACTAL